MRNHRGPPTLCGSTPSFPNLQLRQGKEKILPLEGTPEQPYPRLIFFPSVTSPTCSLLFYLAQVAQENNQYMKDKPLQQHTPERFPPPGKSSGPGYAECLPTSHHATLKAPAVDERTHPQQNARTHAEYSYSATLFPQVRRRPVHVHPNPPPNYANSKQIVHLAKHAGNASSEFSCKRACKLCGCEFSCSAALTRWTRDDGGLNTSGREGITGRSNTG